MRAKRALDVIRRLVEQHMGWPMLSSLREKTDTGYRPYGKPGEAIERLSPEERELIQGLTSKDMENERWPFYDGWFDKTEEDTQNRVRRIWRKKIDQP